MSARPNFAFPGSTLTVATAALATVIAFGILWGVVTLFQNRGAPMERLVAAERACAQYVYLSEHQACMNEWLAASQPRIVALETPVSRGPLDNLKCYSAPTPRERRR
jgi:hypothetical protein